MGNCRITMRVVLIVLIILIAAVAGQQRCDYELEYDYVIVGAGTGGTALAYKLSEDGSKRILLIEEGGRDRALPKIYDTTNWFGGLLFDDRIEKFYETEAEPALNDRKIWQPRAKVYGGCNSHNAMVWILGNKKDFDGGETEIGHRVGWGEVNQGWKWADIAHYWSWIDRATFRTTSLRRSDPFIEDFIVAAKECGYDYNPDQNDLSGTGQNGVSPRKFMAYTETADKNTLGGEDSVCDEFANCAWAEGEGDEIHGVRTSVWTEYGRELLKRPNVDIVIYTRVDKLLVEESEDGSSHTIKGVIGVDVESGRPYKFVAKEEYILSAGTYDTPKILMLSGVGPRDHLESLGIDVVVENDAVGSNLQDHTFTVVWGPPLKPEFDIPTRYFANYGVVAVESDGMFYNSLTAETEFVTFSRNAIGSFAETFHYDSRGSVRLRSADPKDKPIVTQNYLSTARDRLRAVNTVRKGRELIYASNLRQYYGPIEEEIAPGHHIQTDEEIIAWLRDNASGDFHPAGACAMGPDGCVDHELKFHGIDNLRIADGSIMPELVSGNPNQITMIIGFKAADMILGVPPPTSPASDRCCCIWNNARGCLPGFLRDRCASHPGFVCAN